MKTPFKLNFFMNLQLQIKKCVFLQITGWTIWATNKIVKMLLLCGALLIWASSCQAVLQEVVQWNFVSYNFPSNTGHKSNFRPENTVITGLDVGYERLYVSTPRLRTGIPATLSSFSRNVPAGSSPVLEVNMPYIIIFL